MNPFRAFLLSFSAGLLTLVSGQAAVNKLFETPPEAPLKGPLNVPTA